MGVILVALLLVCAGTAMAGEQSDSPAILASLQTSETIVTLDDESMDRIEGTFFCLPKDHPPLAGVVCEFFSIGPGGDVGRLEWMLDTFAVHVESFRAQLINCLCKGSAIGNGVK
jgi:hypothetical protein